MRAAAVSLLVVVLAACGRDAIQPGPFTMTGTWTAAADAYEWTFLLNQDGASIRGTGELRTEGASLPLDVQGLWEFGGSAAVGPSVDLVLRSEGFADARFAGNFLSRDTVRGVLSGSGFANLDLRLVRPVAAAAAASSPSRTDRP